MSGNRNSGESHHWGAHQRPVVDIDFSPDGKLLASCSGDRTMSIWNAGTWEQKSESTGDSPFAFVDFSSDGQLLSIGNETQFLSFDVASFTYDEPTLVNERSANFTAYCSSPGGKLVAKETAMFVKILSGTSPPTVLSECIDPILLDKSHEGYCRLAFNSDGTLLASGSADQTVKLWDTSAGQLLLTLRGNSTGYVQAVFRPEGDELAVMMDRRISIYETTGRKLNHCLAFHSAPIQAFATSSDQHVLRCVAYSEQLSIAKEAGWVTKWDTRSDIPVGVREFTAEPHNAHHDAIAVALSPDATVFAYAIRGHPFLIRKDNSISLRQVLGLHQASLRHVSLAFSQDASTLWATVDKELFSVDATSGAVTGSWRNSISEATIGHSALTAIAELEDTVAVASRDGTVKLFSKDLSSGPADEWQMGSPAQCLAASENRQLVAAGTLSGSVQLRDCSAGATLATITAHQSRVTSIDFAYNRDDIIATASNDGSLFLWKFSNSQLQKLCALSEPASERPVIKLEFLDHGKKLVALRQDDLYLNVWQIDTLEKIFAEYGIAW